MSELQILVVLALPDEAVTHSLSLPEGSCVADALRASGLDQHPAAPADLDGSVGIWNQHCELTQILQDGDRVEIYRPLTVDPMVARRRRAAHKAKG